MKLDQNIRSESYLRTNVAEILDKLKETRTPIVITRNGEAAAILQDIESFERTKQALLMLKIMALSEAEIKKGNYSKHQDVMDRIENKLNAMRGDNERKV
ncbi:type II toxin-antitoxin system Phd/YefM family antitoxin [candidate division KSB1 bacterium]|nr:type II toxin-antitoxin system Phd/YefM family antitoxin [candidate division KSB1 bacterium]